MYSQNEASLEVDFMSLINSHPDIGSFLIDAPKEMLEIFDTVATEVLNIRCPGYVPNIVDECHVRIPDLPIQDSLRDLHQELINVLVKVQGVVTRRSPVYPQLKECTYNCMQCGYQSLLFAQTGTTETKPSSCVGCQGNGPFKLNTEKTVYRNYQKMMLQETPGTVAPGRVPRQREVIVTADLIDRARPGEEIMVVGIYQHSPDTPALDAGGGKGGGGFPVFSTCIEANCITKRDDAFSVHSVVAPSSELIDRAFGDKDAISVQQTMRGCLQECCGCEAESEYKVYPGHVEQGQKRAEGIEQFGHLLEDSPFFARLCLGEMVRGS